MTSKGPKIWGILWLKLANLDLLYINPSIRPDHLIKSIENYQIIYQVIDYLKYYKILKNSYLIHILIYLIVGCKNPNFIDDSYWKKQL